MANRPHPSSNRSGRYLGLLAAGGPGAPAGHSLEAGSFASFHWREVLAPGQRGADDTQPNPGRLEAGNGPEEGNPEGWQRVLVAYPFPDWGTEARPWAEPRWRCLGGWSRNSGESATREGRDEFCAAPHLEFILAVRLGPVGADPAGAPARASGNPYDCARTSLERTCAAGNLVLFELVGTRPRAALAQLAQRLLGPGKRRRWPNAPR